MLKGKKGLASSFKETQDAMNTEKKEKHVLNDKSTVL